jgi:hypothetical protein
VKFENLLLGGVGFVAGYYIVKHWFASGGRIA